MKTPVTYLKTLCLIVILFVFNSCEDKDPNELINDSKPLIIATDDLNLTIEEGTVSNGDSIGNVKGTSNKGTVNYSITAQSPENTLIIENDGTLIVNNESAFVIGETITLDILVSKEDQNKTANVTIEVIAQCPSVDLFAFEGTLLITADDSETVEGTGIEGDCGQLTLQGDLINYGCDLDSEFVFQFFPTDDESGTLELKRQAYNCIEGGTLEIEATGTYDLIEETITLDYTLFENNVESSNGTIAMQPSGICSSNVDTSIWDGNIMVVEEGIGEISTTAISGCGDIIVLGDIALYEDCTETTEIRFKLTPNNDGDVEGTVTVDLQDYACDGSLLTLSGSGTYNETTGTIILDYELFDDGEPLYPGTINITPY